jgi:hypothetical protein
MSSFSVCPHCGARLSDELHVIDPDPHIANAVMSPDAHAQALATVGTPLPLGEDDHLLSSESLVIAGPGADSILLPDSASEFNVVASGQESESLLPESRENLVRLDGSTSDTHPIGSELSQHALWPADRAAADASGLPVGSLREPSVGSQSIEAMLRPSLLRSYGLLGMTLYASALTLTLTWLTTTGRVRWGPQNVRRGTEQQAPNEGQRGEGPLAALPLDRLASLGAALRVRDLEFVPLEVRSDSAWLRNTTSGDPPFRKGGVDCLWLRFKVRNMSPTDAFVPLEVGFVREPEQGRLESFIEAGEQTIGLFPLAQTSEWVVDGEEFPKLAPGEERELIVVSAPAATRKLAARMIWRLRLRVAAGKTTVVGVNFTRGDVR